MTATQGLALGCAGGEGEGEGEGEVMTVADVGSFEVEKRGGNVGVLLHGSNLGDVVEPLDNAFAKIGGRVEAPGTAHLVVATVPVSAGFESIERALREVLLNRSGVEWGYGNVYDERDQPLNWWLPRPSST